MGDHLRPPRCWIAQPSDSRSRPSARLVADSSAALDPISIFVAVATHDPVAVLVTATAPTLIVIPELEAETRAAPAAVPVPITVPATVAVSVVGPNRNKRAGQAEIPGHLKKPWSPEEDATLL